MSCPPRLGWRVVDVSAVFSGSCSFQGHVFNRLSCGRIAQKNFPCFFKVVRWFCTVVSGFTVASSGPASLGGSLGGSRCVTLLDGTDRPCTALPCRFFSCTPGGQTHTSPSLLSPPLVAGAPFASRCVFLSIRVKQHIEKWLPFQEENSSA